MNRIDLQPLWLRVAALMFLVPATAKAQTLLFTLAGADPGDNFGRALAAAGDVDGDGFRDLVAGSGAGGSAGGGYVRVHSGRNGSLIWERHGTSAGEGFGASVAGDADFDGDGRPDIVVGAPRSAPPAMSPPGQVHVLSGTTGAIVATFPAPWRPDYGAVVSFVGDIDGDGRSEVAAGTAGWNPYVVYYYGWPQCLGGAWSSITILSGSGAVLRTHLMGNAGTPVAGPMGDVDGDGRADYFVGHRGGPVGGCGGSTGTLVVTTHLALSRLQLVSGLSGALLQDHVSAPLTSLSAANAGDVDGDGIADLASRAARPIPPTWFESFLGVISGTATASGIFIHALFEPAPVGGSYRVVGLGDVDGDGRSELLLGDDHADQVRILSGATGLHLASVPGPPSSGFGGYIAALGDINGDGAGDFAVRALSVGGVQVWSGRTLPPAQVTLLGPGCGPGPVAPILVFHGPPRLGATLLLDYVGGTPGAAGALIAGGLPVSPVPVAPGCFGWLDPTHALVVAPVQLDVTGSWSLSLPLPNVPAAAGLEVALQAFAAPVPGPAGIELTDGWRIRFGY